MDFVAYARMVGNGKFVFKMSYYLMTNLLALPILFPLPSNRVTM